MYTRHGIGKCALHGQAFCSNCIASQEADRLARVASGKTATANETWDEAALDYMLSLTTGTASLSSQMLTRISAIA